MATNLGKAAGNARLVKARTPQPRKLDEYEYAGSVNMLSKQGSDRQPTMLERTYNQLTQNTGDINEIGDRIESLLDRLRGPSAKGGDCNSEGLVSQGILNDMLSDQEHHSRRLGEIKSDLTLLESLL